jgi:hypothetical protein
MTAKRLAAFTAYLILTLQIFVAGNTSYFSAASASSRNVLNGVMVSMLGNCQGYTNWNNSSRMLDDSVKSTTPKSLGSARVANSEDGKAPAHISRFFRWILNCTPSQDKKVTSASLAETWIQVEIRINPVIW